MRLAKRFDDSSIQQIYFNTKRISRLEQILEDSPQERGIAERIEALKQDIKFDEQYLVINSMHITEVIETLCNRLNDKVFGLHDLNGGNNTYMCFFTLALPFYDTLQDVLRIKNSMESIDKSIINLETNEKQVNEHQREIDNLLDALKQKKEELVLITKCLVMDEKFRDYVHEIIVDMDNKNILQFYIPDNISRLEVREGVSVIQEYASFLEATRELPSQTRENAQSKADTPLQNEKLTDLLNTVKSLKSEVETLSIKIDELKKETESLVKDDNGHYSSAPNRDER